MFISPKFILSLIVISSMVMIKSMDMPNNKIIKGNDAPIIVNGLKKPIPIPTKPIKPIRLIGKNAFFPSQVIINEANELGLECPVGTPCVTVKFTNKDDFVCFNHFPSYKRNLLHIPFTAIVNNCGVVETQNSLFIFDQNTLTETHKVVQQFYNSPTPIAKIDLNDFALPTVQQLHEDNFIRRQEEGGVAKITFGIDEN